MPAYFFALRPYGTTPESIPALAVFGRLLKLAIAAESGKFTLQRLLLEVDAGVRELKAAVKRI